jgi:hypothetical protein
LYLLLAEKFWDHIFGSMVPRKLSNKLTWI